MFTKEVKKQEERKIHMAGQVSHFVQTDFQTQQSRVFRSSRSCKINKVIGLTHVGVKHAVTIRNPLLQPRKVAIFKKFDKF